MNPNKKVWYFVEGHADTNLVLGMYRNFFCHVEICKSPDQFLKHKGLACYIHNSESVDRIPFDINKYGHFPVRAEAEIIIICDVEKLGCHTERKNKIIKTAREDAPRYGVSFNDKNLYFVLSKPTLEEIYCHEVALTSKILKTRFSIADINISILSDEHHTPHTRIKNLFKQYEKRYDKVGFSEKFFHQLDYKTCANPIIQRLVKVTEKIFGEALQQGKLLCNTSNKT